MENFDSLPWQLLEQSMEGSLSIDLTTRMLYATDASVYREMPAAVAVPRHEADVQAIVKFGSEHGVPVIPRTAGTSLAGQVVGSGIVVDFSVHFGSILEVDTAEQWVRVQPGVIRDELNRHLAPMGYFFGPNTSTASRCMIGGMVGNNSAGTTSVKYGTTRDKIIGARAILSDGSLVHFGPLSQEQYQEKLRQTTLEGKVYQVLDVLLSNPDMVSEIKRQYPHPSIHRRNTGYALDVMLQMAPYTTGGDAFNMAKLLAGAEGTLCLITEIKLAIDPLPPAYEAVVCAHFRTLGQSMQATVVAMRHEPYACELMDKTILDCTKANIEQAENRFFIEDDPAALLCIELRHDTATGLHGITERLIEDLRNAGLGYAYPVVMPPDITRVWNLRAAGLGVLSNMPGTAKPIAFVEDTAVRVEDLPQYIEAFELMMDGFGQRAVYYAHAGAGELHIRPVLDLKAPEGRKDFRAIAEASADLVKKYNGSLSGEHGDGRVRAEFIPRVLGEQVYQALRQVKQGWDPSGIFNPGKITDAPPMDTGLRYRAGQPPFKYPAFIDFSRQGNLLLAAEACNGSGECRRPHHSGAGMCPSYQASRNEHDSTRARANALREVLTNPPNAAYPIYSESLHDVMDRCMSCKLCKRECPSNVDMALMKAEVSWQYGRRHGFSMKDRFFGNFHSNAPLASALALLANSALKAKGFSALLKRHLGIAPQRNLPTFAGKRASRLIRHLENAGPCEMILYLDEFTEFQDAHIALAAAEVLNAAGIAFKVVYAPSARALVSKGMLDKARRVADKAYHTLLEASENEIPIAGLEPSAILGFRDDLLQIVSPEHRELAQKLAGRILTFEEYMAGLVDAGRLGAHLFVERQVQVHVHLHCHQKALSHIRYTRTMLSVLPGHTFVNIPSGCCGMAGSFGYEEKHYDLSMAIGELVLFPRVRQADVDAMIMATGTSCRHQIADGTTRKALHPAEVLRNALKA